MDKSSDIDDLKINYINLVNTVLLDMYKFMYKAIFYVSFGFLIILISWCFDISFNNFISLLFKLFTNPKTLNLFQFVFLFINTSIIGSIIFLHSKINKKIEIDAINSLANYLEDKTVENVIK